MLAAASPADVIAALLAAWPEAAQRSTHAARLLLLAADTADAAGGLVDAMRSRATRLRDTLRRGRWQNAGAWRGLALYQRRGGETVERETRRG